MQDSISSNDVNFISESMKIITKLWSFHVIIWKVLCKTVKVLCSNGSDPCFFPKFASDFTLQMSIFSKKYQCFFQSCNLRLNEMARNCRQLPTGEEMLAHTCDLFLFTSTCQSWLQLCKTCCCRPADQNTGGSAQIVFLDTPIVLWHKHLASDSGAHKQSLELPGIRIRWRRSTAGWCLFFFFFSFLPLFAHQMPGSKHRAVEWGQPGSSIAGHIGVFASVARRWPLTPGLLTLTKWSQHTTGPLGTDTASANTGVWLSLRTELTGL